MFVACVVCARPLDALLTNGLHAGVAALAVVAVVVLAGLTRGVVAIVRADDRTSTDRRPTEVRR